MAEIQVGMVVVKKSGPTEFYGRVVAAYDIEPGERRIDVVSIAPGSRRLVHLYLPSQFRPATRYEIEMIEHLTQQWDAILGGRDEPSDLSQK